MLAEMHALYMAGTLCFQMRSSVSCLLNFFSFMCINFYYTHFLFHSPPAPHWLSISPHFLAAKTQLNNVHQLIPECSHGFQKKENEFIQSDIRVRTQRRTLFSKTVRHMAPGYRNYPVLETGQMLKYIPELNNHSHF